MRASVLTLVLSLLSFVASAAPKAELWQRWSAHDEAGKVAVDHVAWTGFLGKYVKPGADGINRVAYGAVTAADKARLDAYLQMLQGLSISKFARSEQRPYWINLYNAATIKTILDHYPVASILKINISPGLFAKGPWGKKQLNVEGEALALDDIEHRILRPLWNDPRTHYAVNCASIGCPNLALQAYTTANIETLLDAGARAYVNHPRGASIAGGKLRTSSIYRWFREDFGGSEAGVIAHLQKYAEAPLAQSLQGIGGISGDDYDWSLNGV